MIHKKTSGEASFYHSYGVTTSDDSNKRFKTSKFEPKDGESIKIIGIGGNNENEQHLFTNYRKEIDTQIRKLHFAIIKYI